MGKSNCILIKIGIDVSPPSRKSFGIKNQWNENNTKLTPISRIIFILRLITFFQFIWFLCEKLIYLLLIF